MAQKENRDKQRKQEIKRGIEILNQNFEKIFKKPLDNSIFLWYNLTRSAKEIGWYRTKHAVSITITEEENMSTYMAKKETLERAWYVIDAAGKPVGKTAALAASILNGKHKPTYTPHVDCGDHVVIINASKAIFTGKKLTDKMYYHHSGYIGGLKFISANQLMKTNPEAVLELAVKGMLPHNSIGAASFNRLKVYADADHKQQAQKPTLIEA